MLNNLLKSGFLKIFLAILLCALSLSPLPAGAEESSKFLALGTGTLSGLFHPVGVGVCHLVNEGRLEHGFRCLAYPTGAAVNNLQGLDSGDLDLAMTYANLLQEARNAVGPFANDVPMRDLNLVAYLYEMPLVIIYNKDLSVDGLADLAGLRINIGNVGSGKRTIADTVFAAMGWKRGDFSSITELDTSEVEAPFCRGEIDAMVEAVSIDTDFIDRVTRKCNGKFISLDEFTLKKMVDISPGLGAMTIPGEQYPNNESDVQTISVNVVLATSKRVNAEAIYTATKAIYSNFKEFRALNPVMSSRFKSIIIKRDKSLPFHEGAIRYYKEQGWDWQ